MSVNVFTVFSLDPAPSHTFTRPFATTTFSSHSFPVAASTLWNKMSAKTRSVVIVFLALSNPGLKPNQTVYLSLGQDGSVIVKVVLYYIVCRLD